MSNENDTVLSAQDKKIIEASLAVEQELAIDAGAVGYMARVLTQATLPHRNPKQRFFERSNGILTVTIADTNNLGLPYGSLPRLLLSWVTSEAVITKNKHIILGDSLSQFMGELGLTPTGGRWGSITRLKDQTSRLFGCNIGYKIETVDKLEAGNLNFAKKQELWWTASSPGQTSMFESYVDLSQDFFEEIIDRPVPIDLRALQALRRSPMAIDIYTWLTYRMSYLDKKTAISWKQLQMQFGAGYEFNQTGLENFQRAFTKHLKSVLQIYPEARIDKARGRLILKPSKPHIAKTSIIK